MRCLRFDHCSKWHVLQVPELWQLNGLQLTAPIARNTLGVRGMHYACLVTKLGSQRHLEISKRGVSPIRPPRRSLRREWDPRLVRDGRRVDGPSRLWLDKHGFCDFQSPVASLRVADSRACSRRTLFWFIPFSKSSAKPIHTTTTNGHSHYPPNPHSLIGLIDGHCMLYA